MPMHQSKTRAVIYARKSSEGEDKQVLSIESQISELALYASRTNLSIEKVFSESRSARLPGRPVFEEMMYLLQHKKAEAILCWKLDRLARNPIDGGRLIWALEKGEVKEIHTPHHAFKNTSDDKFWMQLEFGMAKKYVNGLSENVKRGFKRKLADGWFPNQAPFGYLNDRNHPQGRRQIIPDPRLFAQIRSLWELLLTDRYSVNQIFEITQTRLDFPKKLSRLELYRMFHNPFYSGRFLYNQVLHEGKHQAMITPQEYERAQKILAKGRIQRKPGKKYFVYSGLLRCGECGAAITAEGNLSILSLWVNSDVRSITIVLTGLIRIANKNREQKRNYKWSLLLFIITILTLC